MWYLPRMKRGVLALSLLTLGAGAALAGAFVGVAVVLLVSAAGPLAAAGSPATKLTAGAVFGVALTLVVFAGAELFTGNNMTMLIGRLRGHVSTGEAIAVNIASLAGNIGGAIGFAAMVHGSGVLSSGAKPGQPAPGAAMVASLVHGKIAAPDAQLFWRAVLCNMLVCLALWMATRASGDAAKCIVLFWGLLAFIASGFEHSIANVTLFSLAIFQGSASWSDLWHNLILTVPGNIVGGALLVAMPYVAGDQRERRMRRLDEELAAATRRGNRFTRSRSLDAAGEVQPV